MFFNNRAFRASAEAGTRRAFGPWITGIVTGARAAGKSGQPRRRN